MTSVIVEYIDKGTHVIIWAKKKKKSFSWIIEKGSRNLKAKQLMYICITVNYVFYISNNEKFSRLI